MYRLLAGAGTTVDLTLSGRLRESLEVLAVLAVLAVSRFSGLES
ncbi:hypothetical protein [Arthrobacter sp. HLT1-20]